MHPPPYFDRGTETVRFRVAIGDALIDASVGRVVLHYRYHAGALGDDPLSTYTQHSAEIDDAVRRRMAAGAREPVMLRDADLAAAEAR